METYQVNSIPFNHSQLYIKTNYSCSDSNQKKKVNSILKAEKEKKKRRKRNLLSGKFIYIPFHPLLTSCYKRVSRGWMLYSDTRVKMNYDIFSLMIYVLQIIMIRTFYTCIFTTRAYASLGHVEFYKIYNYGNKLII